MKPFPTKFPINSLPQDLPAPLSSVSVIKNLFFFLTYHKGIAPHFWGLLTFPFHTHPSPVRAVLTLRHWVMANTTASAGWPMLAPDALSLPLPHKAWNSSGGRLWDFTLDDGPLRAQTFGGSHTTVSSCMLFLSYLTGCARLASVSPKDQRPFSGTE